MSEQLEFQLIMLGVGAMMTWLGWGNWTRRARFINYRSMVCLPGGLALLCLGIGIMLPIAIGVAVWALAVAFGLWAIVMIIFALPGLNYRVGYPRWFREYERAKEQRR